jgi:hypothetical protein
VYQYECDSFVVSRCAPLSYLYYKQSRVAWRGADAEDRPVYSMKCRKKNVLFDRLDHREVSFITASRTKMWRTQLFKLPPVRNLY